MIIESLIVKKTAPVEETIRTIKFNPEGLSLIVDETKTESDTESGNDVGKTTAMKIINLCLGASSTSELYKDGKDTKSENHKVKKFIQDNKVTAILTLTDSKKKIVLERNLFRNGKSFINGEKYTINDFNIELKNIIFNSTEKSPSFRELISRFIRINTDGLDKLIRYLHVTTPNTKYESIFLFFLNAVDENILGEKTKLTNELSELNNSKKFFSKEYNISSPIELSPKLQLIEDQLKELTESRNTLNYIEEYRTELNKKGNIERKIKSITDRMEQLKFEISLNENSIKDINSSKSDIDSNVIKAIYSEAGLYLDKLTKSYEDLVNFHNQMIENRVRFIKKTIEKKNQELDNFNNQQYLLLQEKEKITLTIIDENLLNDLHGLNEKIDALNVEKGETQEIIKALEIIESKIGNLEKLLKDNSKEFSNDIIVKRINIFNKYFNYYTKKLYDESYYLSYNPEWQSKKGQPFTINNMSGNVGSGKKTGIIIAFDFAYLDFSNELDLYMPKFIIHDKLEVTHENQIKTIFEMSQEIDGQYFVSILSEKLKTLPTNMVKSSVVLTLSQKNKFFKIESSEPPK